MLARPENQAAANGPAALPWWRDWRGQAVAIVASGPSVKQEQVALLRGRLRVIAIKRSVELCPWADVAYACDAHFWSAFRGLPEFAGLKLGFEDGGQPCVHRVQIPKLKCDELLFAEPGVIGSGRNSGFQAMNIAAQFGVARMLLLGFDSSDRAGQHWYGRNNWMGASNPLEANFEKWRSAFATAAGQLEQLGVEVVNASPHTSLTCFPRGGVAEVLDYWGL